MKIAKLYILGCFLTFYACESKQQKEVHQISDYVKISELLLPDTSKYVNRSDFFSEFDTIPIQFGYQIFDSIINKLPLESSAFKRTWSWEIDTIQTILVKHTNLRLDPKHKLSNDTYFFVIYFLTKDSLPIAATIFTDLKNDQIGTYTFSDINFKYARIHNDIEKIDNLTNKLKTYYRE